MDGCGAFMVYARNYKVCPLLNSLKICYGYVHNMFRLLRPSLFKSFYSTTPQFNNNNYNGGGGGGDDPKLFYLFVLGITIYSVNKLLK